MEFFSRMPSGICSPATRLILTDQKTGCIREYPLFENGQVKSFKGNNLLKELDMTKLEVEYDYDTDYEQMRNSKSMLIFELSEAIDFFVKDDP